MRRERDRGERMAGLAENAPDMEKKRPAPDDGAEEQAGEREESPPNAKRTIAEGFRQTDRA